jgi:hypothetical protein
MPVISSSEFRQDVDKAERLAKEGPVFIDEDGKTISVLLSFEDYKKLSGREKNIAELISMGADDNIDFDPPTG